MRSRVRVLALIVLACAFCAPARAAEEPSVRLASEWWPELTNVVTPVAWRNHTHRFTVVFDGTVLALPRPQKLLRFEWGKGEPLEGVQLSFTPSADGAIPPEAKDQYPVTLPGGQRVGDQGWLEGQAAPVLWSRWQLRDGPMTGLTLRQQVFAHMSGGGEPQSGVEPMFAWIRLEVAARAADAGAKQAGFLIRINAPHIRFEMNESDNCRAIPAVSAYPKPLRFEANESGGAVIEEGGSVRLAILSGSDGASIKFHPAAEGQRDHYLQVVLPADDAAHVDLLLPMIPASGATLKEELALGFDGALRQADAFWSPRPDTAATIHTPEPLINAAIANNIRLARMMTTMIPATKQRSMICGAMYYSYVWVTPSSLTQSMMLDPLGWHEQVDQYLEIYRQEQGRRTAPGPDFKPHPGYFAPPDALDSGNQWLGDHGVVLHSVARHALLTRDQAFIERWREPILKACDFIIQGRRLPRKPPAADGVMPPASASDLSQPIQALWSDGFSHKGLVTAARLLRELNHPRAAELEREAADYRQAIERALAAKAARQPRWTDASGQSRPIVPMTLTTDDTDGLGHEHPFFLDSGPTTGVYTGVLRADNPLMRDAIAFLREGPHTRQPNASDLSWRSKPRLIHEISSAEPCYSWSIFHSHQLGDRQRFLEGMYSLFCGALSRQTHVSCETRGGITDNVFAGTLATCLARLAVVDDELDPGNLHLLRLVPLAWVSDKERTRFENMPTEFGPVTLKWQLTDDGRTLKIEYAPHFRRPPEAVLLHVPPVEGLEKVVINDQERAYKADDPIRL